MIKKFKIWIYRFIFNTLIVDHEFDSVVKNSLLWDKNFMKNFYVVLETEQKRVAAERKDREKREIIQLIIDNKKGYQDNCTHLKGGGFRAIRKDFNIRMHVFPGEVGTTVKCLTCEKEWKGEQLKSEEVQFMMQHTTNTLSASEIILGKPVDRNEPPQDYSEKTSRPILTVMDYIVGQMKKIRRFNKRQQEY